MSRCMPGAVYSSASWTEDGSAAATLLRIAPSFMTVGHFEVCKGTDPFSGWRDLNAVTSTCPHHVPDFDPAMDADVVVLSVILPHD